MKKTVMILALAMFSFANAQKGSVLVMGNIGFTSRNDISVGSETTYNVITFSPKVGYQFNDSWTAGLDSSVESGKFTSDNGNTKQNNFSIGGFVRYAKPLGGIFSTYIDLGAGFLNSKTTNYDDGNSIQAPNTTINKNEGYYVGATPSLFLNINKGFGLNFNIGGVKYTSIKENGSSSEHKQFVFNFGSTFNVGFSKNF